MSPYNDSEHEEHQQELDAASRRRTMEEVLGFAHRTRGEQDGGATALVILVDALGLDLELEQLTDGDVERQQAIERARLNIQLS